MKEHIGEYVDHLNKIAKGNYKAVTLFITDVVRNGSYVLYNEDAKSIVEDSFDLPEAEEGMFIPNIVSRKKQILPNLVEILERRS